MTATKIFYDETRECIFVQNMRQAFQPLSLDVVVNPDNGKIMVTVKYSPDAAIWQDFYTELRDVNGNTFPSTETAIAYLQNEFLKKRAVAMEYNQGTPADVWIIPHTLGFKPNAIIHDSSGNQILAPISYPDQSTVRIDFGAPMTGTANLS